MEPNPFQSGLQKVGPLETKPEGPEIIRERLEFVVSYDVSTYLVHSALLVIPTLQICYSDMVFQYSGISTKLRI